VQGACRLQEDPGIQNLFTMMLIENLTYSRVVRRIVRVVLPFRFLINIIVHAAVFSMSYFYSLLLFNNLVFDRYMFEMFAVTLWPLLIIRLVVFHHYSLFSGMWRFVSFEDLINIIRAVVFSTCLLYGLCLIWDRILMGDEVYLLDMTFCIVFTSGIRLLVRNFRETHLCGDVGHIRKKILLLGPTNKVQSILKDILGDPKTSYAPVAIIDPDESGHSVGRRICDIPIFGIAHVVKIKKKLGPMDSVIICWPGVGRRQLDHIIEQLQPLKSTFQIIPHLDEIIDGRVSIKNIRHVEIDDLLDRDPIQIDLEEISAYIKGKSVMVTGGAGSIGSEICRQVAGFDPLVLYILDRSENSLCDFEREITTRFPKLDIVAVVSSINDAVGLKSAMLEHRIDVVFHAAAYKHVPLMEKTPIESAYNNIIGTCNAAHAAIEAGVKRFVMISTDKAVNPTNVMGVTKRIAEMNVQSLHRKEGTRFMTVRFGNVLGSAGSVVPIFKSQIERGEPLTVTHPEIERFFMTIPEAVQLVLQAGCIAEGGEIFVLDMGRPVKILKLAEKLITLSGLRPYEDIDINFTGLRPGEKMYEELFCDSETLLPTRHPQIRTAQCQLVGRALMAEQMEEMKEIITRKDVRALYGKFVDLVPGYTCYGLREKASDSRTDDASVHADFGLSTAKRVVANR
jgi:FlaA1/EpsC-like NDP-sugar epimerase